MFWVVTEVFDPGRPINGRPRGAATPTRGTGAGSAIDRGARHSSEPSTAPKPALPVWSLAPPSTPPPPALNPALPAAPSSVCSPPFRTTPPIERAGDRRPCPIRLLGAPGEGRRQTRPRRAPTSPSESAAGETKTAREVRRDSSDCASSSSCCRWSSSCCRISSCLWSLSWINCCWCWCCCWWCCCWCWCCWCCCCM